MVEILNREVIEGHNCRDELPRGRANVQPLRSELEWKLVARCSCGRIWRTRAYGWSFTEWVPAWWWQRWYYAFRSR